MLLTKAEGNWFCITNTIHTLNSTILLGIKDPVAEMHGIFLKRPIHWGGGGLYRGGRPSKI